jgi:signal transduction histidine kinase
MTNQPTILVVDDSIAIVDIIEKILKKNSYKIIKAYNGEEALKKVSEEQPDLIILDIMMPKMDGLEVLRRLRTSEETRLIPVVMLTSMDYVEDKIAGFSKGADDYITKPFHPKELLARINSLVDKRIYQKKRSEEEKQQALEKMIEEVAHEVRNPILAIGGFARRIREKLPNEDMLIKYADHIIIEAERLEDMVDKIINLEALAVNINEHIDVEQILNTAVHRFSADIDKKKINIKKQFQQNVPLVLGDREKLTEAFSNIIENGLEAISSTGILSLNLGHKDQYIIINISDSGIGIPNNDLNDIFRPFYTSKMTGAGMGLALAKHIVSQHGGEIAVSSIPGESTTVTISLPV